jgi:hypothetical protein
MAKTETKYKLLINRLANAKPVADNPGLLTDEIMRTIRLHKKTSTRMLVWVRPFMTAAAIFLFGLFFYQQSGTMNNLQEATALRTVKLTPHNQDCSSELTPILPEKRKLLNEYICYMKSNQVENEKSKNFYLKYLSKNQGNITH